MQDAKTLRWNLKSLGLSEAVLDAAWPTWWSEAADASTSAQTELRFSLSRKLGLDPRSLIRDDPKFVWSDFAKFKHLTVSSETEHNILASFGVSFGRLLIGATPNGAAAVQPNPETYRQAVLKSRPYVGLTDLLAICWSSGIPVVFLETFALTQKRMAAMAIRVGDNYAILLGRSVRYPSQIAFYLAHELGHIALGHIQENGSLVEGGNLDQMGGDRDQDEDEADRFALALLTGMTAPRFEPEGAFNAPSIADASIRIGRDLSIEPGVVALCFGHSTGAWPRILASLRMIYGELPPASFLVNSVAQQQLVWPDFSADSADYVAAVLGVDLANIGTRQ